MDEKPPPGNEQEPIYRHDDELSPSSMESQRNNDMSVGPPSAASPSNPRHQAQAPQAYIMLHQRHMRRQLSQKHTRDDDDSVRLRSTTFTESSDGSSGVSTPESYDEPHAVPERFAAQRRRNDPRDQATTKADLHADNPSQYLPAHHRRQAPSPQTSQPSSLAGRRGNAPQPLLNPPESDIEDDEDDSEQDTPRRSVRPTLKNQKQPQQSQRTPTQYLHPMDLKVSSQSASRPGPTTATPDNRGLGRFTSVASVSTTKASRGSPPPSPETPIEGPRVDPNPALYDSAPALQNSKLADADVLNLLAEHRHAAHTPPVLSLPPQRERETCARSTRGARNAPLRQERERTKRQSSSESQSENDFSKEADSSIHKSHGTGCQPGRTETRGVPSVSSGQKDQQLEKDMRRARVTDDSPEPPPAYHVVSSVDRARPEEKDRTSTDSSRSQTSSNPPTPRQVRQQTHPAFSREPRRQQTSSDIESPYPTNSFYMQAQPGPVQTPVEAKSATPPPLPEGWISHLDQHTGHYYYIHLPTQSTQWEFPKGPSPLNPYDPPLSPTGTLVNLRTGLTSPSVASFQSKPMASPGFPSKHSAYADGMYSMGSSAAPSAAGFDGLPPEAGIERYKIEPQNGVYFGPYLRYTNMDIENGIWYGSAMLVTDARFPPTIHIHQSMDLSPDPRQLRANIIARHLRWQFYRYDIDLRMEERDVKWTYAITSHMGCTRYEFLVAGRNENSWRFIAHSGNDFALNVGHNERLQLGGLDYMWRDVLAKHDEVGGFHAQLGLGNQINADRLWKDIPSLRQWTSMKGKENRKNEQWTAHHEEDVTHAYFHYYTSHFDQQFMRDAFAKIPYITMLDDHDIFDGYGSYPSYMQTSHFFNAIGRIGIEFYLLFQHHTTPEILRNVSSDLDIFTVTGHGWHFIKYLGPAVVVVGPDCRSERTEAQVIAGRTYQNLFPKVMMLPACVQHCIWMIPVPVVYPRLEMAEHLAQTVTSGKRVVTGTFNALGKVTSGLAGVVGAKAVVSDGFAQVKKAVGKTGLMNSILSPFGELDILDELRDQWTHPSKDIERTYLIRMLQHISRTKGLRMTFLSGAVNACGAGWLHDPTQPGDPNTMYQIIASSIVNAPPSAYALRMLHAGAGGTGGGGKALYIPENGRRSVLGQPSDTREDMLEVFGLDVTGARREARRLMGRRNYVAVVAFDPALVQDAFQAGGESVYEHGHGASGGTKPTQARGRLSLAVDFMVQAEAGSPSGGTVKYGPIVVPDVQMASPYRGR